MKVIVFGSTGFIGSHITEQLAKAGHEVVCLVRQTSDVTFLKTLDVKIIESHFSSSAELRERIPSGAMVCNCIADTRMHISDDERRIIEIDLTKKIFVAAQEANVVRFIQLSTVMVYGFDRPQAAIDENYEPTPKYGYSRIALERENTLLEAQKKGDMELVLLRPSNTTGLRDSSMLPSILKSHQQGIFPVVGGGAWKFSCADTRDVGRAAVHLLTVKIDQSGIFLMKGYDTDWLAFKSCLDEVLEKKTRLFNMPRALFMFVGRIMEACYKFGSEPALTRFSIDLLSTDTLFDDSKIRDSGFQPLYGLRETLKEATTKARDN